MGAARTRAEMAFTRSSRTSVAGTSDAGASPISLGAQPIWR